MVFGQVINFTGIRVTHKHKYKIQIQKYKRVFEKYFRKYGQYGKYGQVINFTEIGVELAAGWLLFQPQIFWKLKIQNKNTDIHKYFECN